MRGIKKIFGTADDISPNAVEPRDSTNREKNRICRVKIIRGMSEVKRDRPPGYDENTVLSVITRRDKSESFLLRIRVLLA